MKYALFASLLVGLVLTTPFVQAQVATPEIEDRAYVASRVYAALNTHFAHWEDADDVDLDAAYREYLAAALSAADRRAFTLETQAFLARFQNGHTMFLDRALLRTPVGQRLGFTLTFVENQWVVATSELSDLHPGDVVTALDGRPFEAFYRDVRRYLSASTEAWARHVLFVDEPGFYVGGVYFPLAFTLTLDDGRQVRVDRQALPPRPPAPSTEGRWLRDGEVAYVRIPSFKEPRFETDAVALVERFADAETIVVDVRGNTGGSTPRRLLDALMDRPYRWWAGSTPMTPALHQSYAEAGNGWYGDFRRSHLAWPAQDQKPGKTPFRGRVILLVDAGSHSACEDLAMIVKDSGRGTLVGETTAGSTGQPYMLELGNEMMVLVGAMRVRFPDGSVFEGVGIEPDVSVSPRIADLRDGTDPVLERALALAVEER